MSCHANLVNEGALSGMTVEPTQVCVLSEVCDHSPVVTTSVLCAFVVKMKSKLWIDWGDQIKLHVG